MNELTIVVDALQKAGVTTEKVPYESSLPKEANYYKFNTINGSPRILSETYGTLTISIEFVNDTGSLAGKPLWKQIACFYDPQDAADFIMMQALPPSASPIPRRDPYTGVSDSQLIDLLPENHPLYRDSGLWQLRSDDMEQVLFQQDAQMSFRDFLIGSLGIVGTRWDAS